MRWDADAIATAAADAAWINPETFSNQRQSFLTADCVWSAVRGPAARFKPGFNYEISRSVAATVHAETLTAGRKLYGPQQRLFVCLSVAFLPINIYGICANFDLAE